MNFFSVEEVKDIRISRGPHSLEQRKQQQHHENGNHDQDQRASSSSILWFSQHANPPRDHSNRSQNLSFPEASTLRSRFVAHCSRAYFPLPSSSSFYRNRHDDFVVIQQQPQPSDGHASFPEISLLQFSFMKIVHEDPAGAHRPRPRRQGYKRVSEGLRIHQSASRRRDPCWHG